ncbi:hypothetical protein A2397_03400 [Candidatus Amesbacteria bacterium RIFOXYB1_FULL_44_23]|uniref:Rhodanese domain-containing protein n=1 Tax=Candidatus Amesbacteria bacterium RIFOXYB1_FULL_44_23 TaxID=1797263 RepID=A0A1F4ZUG2_9BACT|nr:MAG: hypothetical protein A2397_03400 [Candidatus Amesbacteria bacterium RIFOXYB1_FULL_44_23]
MNKLILAAFLGISSFLFGAYVTPHYLKAGQVNGALTEFGSLSPELFNQAAISGNYVVLDVRTQEEFLLGHLQNARQADYLQISQFSNYLDSLDKNSKYLLYCRTGRRSKEALKLMQSKGFSYAADLSGGISAWATGNYPIIK